ncbi:hypothetical protein M427DRAFT_440158 [Gonapodya prolifera JEL478]|uniref:F-box domain-containing protein n=1 Tax=Gonapodya prolifera (strain JEL478) TaxID=1344416 RepID=A0A139A363_GONPJ|nr:hypothetical protein M427DRAFT_440158 [Gonapodya prolifera JEL478]|eukprot:KXS11247.1 hypothetical protein M427DRAFT_440158 [Gonapodya prolifera JEL478]
MMGASANGVLIKAPNFSHPLESNPPLPQTAQLRASIESDTPFLAVPPVRGQRQGAPSQDQVFATPELVENVLSFLDERDLARCALVGRTWRVPATVFLWRRWSIDLKREDQRRLHVFTSMTPAIRSLVRPLRAELTAGNNDRERRYFSEVGDALRHVAPFVRDWAVDCLAPDLFAVWTVHVIPAGENVVRLRLYNWPPIAAVWINPLLLRCPNFRLLSLSEFTGDVNLPPDLPYLHSLKIAERIPSLVEFDKISRYGNLTRLFVAKIQKREELEALARLSGLTHLLIPYCSVEWDEGP